MAKYSWHITKRKKNLITILNENKNNFNKNIKIISNITKIDVLINQYYKKINNTNSYNLKKVNLKIMIIK